MDFIERILGISPDGGSGSLESLYLALAVAAFGWMFYMRTRARNRMRR
jgi:hypothetical protein